MKRIFNMSACLVLSMALPSTGIPCVIVNGTVLVDNSKVQKVFPGVAIRNAIVK